MKGRRIPQGDLAKCLVSRDDLDAAELVRRHRSKQGHENAFKGPLINIDLPSACRVHTGRHWRLDFAKSNFRLDWLLHVA